MGIFELNVSTCAINVLLLFCFVLTVVAVVIVVVVVVFFFYTSRCRSLLLGFAMS